MSLCTQHAVQDSKIQVSRSLHPRQIHVPTLMINNHSITSGRHRSRCIRKVPKTSEPRPIHISATEQIVIIANSWRIQIKRHEPRCGRIAPETILVAIVVLLLLWLLLVGIVVGIGAGKIVVIEIIEGQVSVVVEHVLAEVLVAVRVQDHLSVELGHELLWSWSHGQRIVRWLETGRVCDGILCEACIDVRGQVVRDLGLQRRLGLHVLISRLWLRL